MMKPCVFIIRIRDPLTSLVQIAKFMIDRGIRLETMQQYLVNKDEALLILHCTIEKDRVKYIQTRMERLKGIIELELLESKASQMVKLEL